MPTTLDFRKKLASNYLKNKPANFGYLSATDRHAWVEKELSAGDYSEAKSQSINMVLNFGVTCHEWSPLYYLYLILLSAFDPGEAATHIKHTRLAVLFIQAYGVERAAPYVPSSLWLEAMSECPFTPEEMKARDMIKLLLKSRGAEAVLPFVKDKETGAHFVEIFGFKSLSLLPDDLANQVKGHYLENELGL
jgi:hypothetical protein